MIDFESVREQIVVAQETLADMQAIVEREDETDLIEFLNDWQYTCMLLEQAVRGKLHFGEKLLENLSLKKSVKNMLVFRTGILTVSQVLGMHIKDLKAIRMFGWGSFQNLISVLKAEGDLPQQANPIIMWEILEEETLSSAAQLSASKTYSPEEKNG